MISVIIPFHNEKENLPILKEKLIGVLNAMNTPYELLFVNDGSTDGSEKAIQEEGQTKIVHLRRQMGKGKALAAGFEASTGEIIVFMDADLEDDPAELPRFYNEIVNGYELVNGVREGRKHSGLIRMYSSVANSFIRSFLRSPFTDINCGYKMMRRTVLEVLPIYGNNFRFLPLGAFYEGFKVTEIPVKHQNRIHGVSKFGPGKIVIGLIDTLTAYFLYRFAERPLHFFGIIGAVLTLIGAIILTYLGIERLVFQHEIYRRPILFLGMLLIIVGVQVAATGLIGELMVYLKNRRSR